MSLLDELKEFGVDVNDGLERCLGKTDFYERYLNKLPEMLEDTEISDSIRNGDYDKAIEKTHAIKGVTGNLAVTPLYKAYSEIVSLLRSDTPEKAVAALDSIQEVQKNIVECIKKYCRK